MIWSAFTIGLLGSLHCVGMCGPIALALPQDQQNRWLAVWKVLLYNFGRATTYIFLGAAIGLVSQGLFLAQLQKSVSIVLGILLIIIALFSINVESRLLKANAVSRFYFFLKQQLARFMGSNRSLSFFKIGLLNGFLPCGLVYMAIVGALSVGGFANSILFMLLFGLGTMPLMLATALAGQRMSLTFRNLLKRAYPVFLVGFGALLIVRGLNLEIPATLDLLMTLKDEILCH